MVEWQHLFSAPRATMSTRRPTAAVVVPPQLRQGLLCARMASSTVVKKAVIPVAGLGTRFLPATKTVPKEMLPIVDTPTLQYIVEEAFAAGIEHVVLVQGRGKGCIEDHFDTSYELQDTLSKRNKTAELAILERISKMGSVTSIRQKAPLGLGHAVLCAKPIVGDEPFAVLLGDDIFRTAPHKRSGIGQLIDNFVSTGKGTVATMTVSRDDIHKYGCAEGVRDPQQPRRIDIDALVEKPPKGTEKSDQAVVGRYVLPPAIWPLLERTPPGRGGEIQLTDALDLLRAQQGLQGFDIDAVRVDAGDKLGYIEANLREAMIRPDLRDGVRALMRQLLDTKEFF
jgi:UTP--glucose-1-phosphate uridylyltransferase